MLHFENYRWEDYTPRPGSWKLDHAYCVVALSLIAVSLSSTHAESTVCQRLTDSSPVA
jgi:hypothetical protein